MIVVERAISLTQPWASLMAIGAKQVETRCWRTNFRGWVAIHAAKGFAGDCKALCYRSPFAGVLAGAGYNKPEDLPRGVILAVTEIIDCKPTGNHSAGITDTQELAFGDYSPARFGIFTHGVRQLKQPITIRGALSIWRLSSPITELDLVAQGEHLVRTALNPAAAWPFPPGARKP